MNIPETDRADEVEKLIRAQDWHYDYAGRDWRDGMLLGNGNVGVLAFAPEHLEWVINKVDVFDPRVAPTTYLTHAEVMGEVEKMERKNSHFLGQREPTQGHQHDSTLSAAILRLKFSQVSGWAAPAVPKVSQILSLYDGELEEILDAHAMHTRLKMLVPRNENVFCVRISGNKPRQALVFELMRPLDERLILPEWNEFENGIAFRQSFPGGEGAYAVALLAVGDSGKPATAKTAATFSVVQQSGNGDVFVAVRSTYDCADPLAEVEAEVKKAAARGFDDFQAANRAWWHNYWRKGWADFGRYKQVQRYWTFGLYEIASSYGKVPMPGLYGLTYGPLDITTPGLFAQGYTGDQNTQIPALAFFPTNRCEFVEVFADTYLSVAGELRRHTKELFGCDGIFVPVCMNQLGKEYPVSSYRYTLCGSAYSGLILALAWRFTEDVELLKNKLYPLLRDFVEFYIAIMRKDDKGIYHLDWSVPPEIFTMTRDDSATISMLRPCLETVIAGSRLLGLDGDKRDKWMDVYAHYPTPAKRPEGGWWGGPDIPLNHKFFGGHQFYPFFPSGAYLDREAAEKTVEFVCNNAPERLYVDSGGQWYFSYEWAAFTTTASIIRLGKRDRGWREIERFLEIFGKENGLFAHGATRILPSSVTEENVRNAPLGKRLEDSGGNLCGAHVLEGPCGTPNLNAKRFLAPVLEGSSAFVFLATEALLQSHDGTIKLFPCVPADFAGSFRKLRARGGFEVSATMTDGKLADLEIASAKSAKFKLQNPLNDALEYIVAEVRPGTPFTMGDLMRINAEYASRRNKRGDARQFENGEKAPSAGLTS